MTAIETKEAASMVAHIARSQVLEAMKSLVTVHGIEPECKQDTDAITCSLRRAYDQLTTAFDLSRNGQR